MELDLEWNGIRGMALVDKSTGIATGRILDIAGEVTFSGNRRWTLEQDFRGKVAAYLARPVTPTFNAA